MKKSHLIKNSLGKFSILTVVIMMFAAALPAAAQRGEKTLGISGGYTSSNRSGYASVFFQYSFAKHVRIMPEIGYAFRNDNASALLVNVDMQFPFSVFRGIKIYPMAGVSYNNWSYVNADNINRIGLDLGGGIDFYMTSNLKINVQGKYTLIKDNDGAYINLGIGYVF